LWCSVPSRRGECRAAVRAWHSLPATRGCAQPQLDWHGRRASGKRLRVPC